MFFTGEAILWWEVGNIPCGWKHHKHSLTRSEVLYHYYPLGYSLYQPGLFLLLGAKPNRRSVEEVASGIA